MKFILTFLFSFFLTCLILNSCKKELSCEDCGGENMPPLAKAGRDTIIILPVDSLLLDGSASKDPDGRITNYRWTKVSGPALAKINNDASAKTVVNNLSLGSYMFELNVTDNDGAFAADTIRIVVDSVVIPDHPPVANVGVDEIIILPVDSVLLDGEISYDPDGQIVSYKWAKISGPSSFKIVNPASVKTTADNLIKGVYEFELTVTDNTGLSAKDTTQITVEIQSAINLPPVAVAGPDVVLNYNLQTCSSTPSTISLNGSASFDTDGSIVDYSWRMLPGPPRATIANTSTMNTSVANLAMDTYYFVLQIKDNKQAIDEDTVMVKIVATQNRPIVSARLVQVGTLSQARENLALATAGNKILFAGGFLASSVIPEKSRVDIYDIVNNTWSTAELSQARYNLGVAVHQNKIFFAGGNYSSSSLLELPSWWIDIYNAASNSWTQDSLSVARAPVGVSAGDKVIFAGGGATDFNSVSAIADVYDATSNFWSTATLSFGRKIYAATTIGTKAFFAGGEYPNDGLTNKIDIYDASSEAWTTSSFSPPFDQGWAPNGIAVSNKNYWAGGWYYSQANYVNVTNHVEIRDENTHSSVSACLFQPNSRFEVVAKNNKIVFFTGTGIEKNKFDIYDISSNTWSIGELSQNIVGASLISINNTIYVAGGYINGVLSNKVWKLEF
jgi:hypothetical protein